MTEERRRELARLAATLVNVAGIKNPPVDPKVWLPPDVKILKKTLRGVCDGTIRFRRGRFFIVWDPTGPRARFGLAHEIAHFLIPEHYQLVMAGHQHASIAEFRSEDAIESEADFVASRLLMPDILLSNIEPEFRPIRQTADEFAVSLTASMVRVITNSTKAAAGILTENGEIRWCCSSEEMANRGWHNQSRKQHPPIKSKTAEVSKNMATAPDGPVRGKVPLPAGDWFTRGNANADLWEEVWALKSYNSVLTILIHE